MLCLIAVALAAGLPQPPPTALEDVARALRRAPAWQTDFTQYYLPAGFQEGTSERGTLVLVPPDRLRFDYTSAPGRVFAVDGPVARLVDRETGSCQATSLDAATLSRLPLATILDPAATARSFRIEAEGRTLTLVPLVPTPDLARVTIEVGDDHLPVKIQVTDSTENRNTFTFSEWKSTRPPPTGTFRPHLLGEPPCPPETR
jgi:outer membrane lipoprotein-sorting protein